MSTFIERNPKERVVEEAFRILAENGYISTRPDPADKIFEVAEKLRLRAQLSREEDQPSEQQ
ncbi:hypothetical protein [Pseudomonas sp. S31]|uniref:hypothetical protein n=1 Tax=Pseudomonas sp. S31 TaxID=1564473 RepID=UPI001914251C|nr:hypothetical protein [Pseudomonas sp. S31]